MGVIIKYRLKCFLKNRMLLFWTLCFPIILSTIFNFVLKDIQNLTPLETISVAVVEGDNETLASLIKEFSNPKSENYILEASFVDENKAHQLLDDNKVSSILYVDQKARVVANKYSYDTTILKSIINSYTRVYSQVEHLVTKDSALFQTLVIEDLFKGNAQIELLKSESTGKDMNMIYFYNIIAMVCLYGMLWGVRICDDAQATQSKRAARINISPLPKLKMLLIDYGIGFVLIASEIFIAFAYLYYVLNISFGDTFPLMALVVLASSLTSLSLGILIGTLKMNFETKVGLISSGTVLLNFLAGMMSSSIPFLIKEYVPVLTYINPADLIVRSFSTMYYSANLDRVYLNITILTGMGIVFLILSYLRVRRVSYASI